MNIIDIQDQLKNFSEDQLINEMQMPSGNAPQFLVLSEIQRRKRVRDDFSKRQAAQQPTVAEEAIAAAGVPQSGIAGMSEAMAPKSTMVQNAVGSAMPEAMRSGGLMQFGTDIQNSISSQEVDPFLDEVEDMAESRFGVDFNEGPGFGLNIDQRVRPAIGRPFPIFSDMGADLPFESPSRYQYGRDVTGMPVKGGPRPLPAIVPFEKGGLVDALFSKTDHGKKLSSNQFEVRKGKDGRRMVYKKGTNIFVGTADKVFDEKYDGGLIRAQDGIPRGLRLNNPGNIRPGAGFFGEIGDDGGYAKFDSDAAGIRAIQRLLKTYGSKHGINTLRGLANRYAPPSDNNPTGNYVDFLSQQTGIGPDEPINLAERGAEIIPAIIGFEQGQQPFSQEMINKAIGAAQFDDEEKIAEALKMSGEESPSIMDSVLEKVKTAASATGNAILKPATASTIYPEPESKDTGVSFLDFLNRNALGPAGRELLGTETEEDLEAKRILLGGQRSGEEAGERQEYEQGNQYFYSEEYQNYLRRLGLNPEKLDPNSVPDSLGTFDVMSPIEHMKAFTPDESGESQMDRFTLGMSKDNVSIIESGATAAQEGATTEDIDKITTAKREDVAPKTVTEKTETEKTTDTETKSQPDKDLDDPKTSGLSSIEEEILALQKKMERDRESDKWLAIAQAGLALMASDNPTLLGAAGEAGIEGLKAFREANDRYQEGVIDLLNARSKLAKNRTGLTQNQANKLAVDYEKIANDMSVDEQTRIRSRILAEQLRMQGGLGMGLMAGNYDIATPSS